MAIIEVIKYNGSPNIFAWKYPNEELGTWTQLIVNESQEAILYKGGQALDLFTAGIHTLETENIPFLNKIINFPFGGRSPFSAEIWYINKAHSLDIKWGTPTPIQLQDPKYKIFVPVSSFGHFGIQIDDSRKFLTKLVGTLSIFDKKSLERYFRGLYLTRVKDAISSYLIKNKISILQINAYLDELSEFIKERMVSVLDDYGIKLVNFYVNDISVPEEDSSVIKLKEALARRAEMDIVGYSYTQERSFDTLEGAAKNTGGGQSGLMGAGIGIGMDVEVGGAMSDISSSINTKKTKLCSNCGDIMDENIRFCGSCGNNTKKKMKNEETSKTVVCSKCGYEFNKNSKFCVECGNFYNPCLNCGADMTKEATECINCGMQVMKLCQKCGHIIVNDNSKFCPECGESLVKTCEKCGVKIEDSSKFCPDCGNKL